MVEGDDEVLIATPDGVYLPFPSFPDWAPIVFNTVDFDRYAKLFQDSRSRSSQEMLDRALETANRYAAVDTNAIEGIYATDRGFTRTVATQAAAWEAVMDARGPHVRGAFEDALHGYEYVLDAATKAVEVSEVWIRQLHEILCATQDNYTVYTPQGPQERPLPKGRYKTLPNSPTLLDGRVHAYAPPLDTPAEMARFITEIRSEAFAAAHPVVQAAYAHYAYVCVHPFADGNGRVARAIASIYLYRAPGVPLVVFVDQRNTYFDALEAADAGNALPFVQFIGARTLDAIGIIRTILMAPATPVTETLSSIHALYNMGEHDEELQAAAARLRNLAANELRAQLANFKLPPQLNINGGPGVLGNVSGPAGYAGVGNDGLLYVSATSAWPVAINIFHAMAVFRRTGEAGTADLVLASRPDDGVEVWVRELMPVESETVKLKVTNWIEAQLGTVLADIERRAAAGRP